MTIAENSINACLLERAEPIIVEPRTRGSVAYADRVLPHSPIMPVRLTTFGSLGATANGSELPGIASQRLRAALLVYLAVERSATRATLETVFWPEIDPDSAGRRLSQTVYAIRQDLGDDVIETRGHEYRATDELEADALDFQRAVDAGSYEVIRLYRGPFLQGVHLTDSNEFENWLSSRRTKYARQFRKACRAEIDASISRVDLAGALKVAQLWVAPDPLDDEAQHSLIELLARVSGRKQARDQYDTYCKLLEADELQPLEETRDLIAVIERETEAVTFSPLDLPVPTRLQSTTLPAEAQAQRASELARDLEGSRSSSVGLMLPEFIRKHPRIAGVMAATVVLLPISSATPLGRQTLSKLMPAPPRYVAVLPFSSTDSADVLLAAGLTQSFTHLVSKLADGNNAVWVLPSSDMLAANLSSPAEVRRIYPVDLVVAGDVRRTGDEVYLGLALFDVRREKPKRVHSLTISRPMDLLSGESAYALLARALRLPRSQSSVKASGRSTHATSPAQRFHLQGIGQLQRAYDAGSLQAAISLFRTALGEDSTYAPAYAGLCAALWEGYVRTGDASIADDARRICDRAVELSRSDPSALVSLGRTQFFTGQWEEAERTLRVATQRNAGADAHRWLGHALEEQGKLAEADIEYRRAIALREDIWVYYADLGDMYMYASRHEEAIPWFREVIRLSPDNFRGYNELGVSLMFLDRLEEAEQAFRQSIDAQPNSIAYRNFGYLYLREHRYDNAVAILERGIAFNKQDWWTWRWLAQAQYWSGDTNGARRSWRRVVELIEPRLNVNPRHQDNLCGLAEALVALGETERGLEHLSFLASLGPTRNITLYWAGRVYEMLGSRRAAVQYINQALARGFDGRTAATDPWLAQLRSDRQYNGPR